ncbi:MAG TPA: MBL fold metallo-hydrolase [Methanocorpusculum sp.]|nr:MBL fold metallo-hydrolase [Methanocorpusculum sp.]
MKITVLGCGDTVGTPKVGCSCEVCRKAKELGVQRLRTSLLIENNGKHLLIDTGPDLRQQLLLAGSPYIDAVIWTHGHYDHFMGFGEFFRVQRNAVQVYGAKEVLDYCGKVYSFIKHDEHIKEPYVPFELFDLMITLFPVEHDTPTYGMRIESDGKVFAYSCDTRAEICERSLDLMRNADLLLLDGIFMPDVKISKHMNIEEAEHLASKLNPKEFKCIHMSHKIPLDYKYAAHDMQVWEL